MKIIVDDKIPYIKGALEPFAEVVYLPGKSTTAEVVKDADALITRTRTICNQNLLEGSKVQIIATATIGFDHIDTNYCNTAGIEWTNAPGCNSWSVGQYVMAALYSLAKEKHFELADQTIGIIGAGNVGAKVEKLCKAIGMRVLVNDPPRQRVEGPDRFVSLETIQKEANIITIHTPLTYEGQDKTFHLIDENFLNGCENEIYLINAARGEVLDTNAVNDAITWATINEVVIDCWENEPEIDPILLDSAFIATPHIAGYSRDGKANGTSMSIQALSRKLGLGIDDWTCTDVELPAYAILKLNGNGKTEQEIISEAILFTYPILEDSNRLKQAVLTFEKQRGDYPVRREFPAYTIKPSDVPDSTLSILEQLGFQIEK
jgi:erythronate-4-phosphate dehydrogenase